MEYCSFLITHSSNFAHKSTFLTLLIHNSKFCATPVMFLCSLVPASYKGSHHFHQLQTYMVPCSRIAELLQTNFPISNQARPEEIWRQVFCYSQLISMDLVQTFHWPLNPCMDPKIYISHPKPLRRGFSQYYQIHTKMFEVAVGQNLYFHLSRIGSREFSCAVTTYFNQTLYKDLTIAQVV